MIFSVFDHHRRVYDYFDAPGTAVHYDARGTKYRAPNGPNVGGIGFIAESLAVPLPHNARRVGEGTTARGLIATTFGTGRSGDVFDAEFRTGPVLGYRGSVGGMGGTVLGEAEVGERILVVKPTFGEAAAAATVGAVIGACVSWLLNRHVFTKKK